MACIASRLVIGGDVRSQGNSANRRQPLSPSPQGHCRNLLSSGLRPYEVSTNGYAACARSAEGLLLLSPETLKHTAATVEELSTKVTHVLPTAHIRAAVG